MERTDPVLNWYVIDTRAGLWIEQAPDEPSRAVAGPYATHQDALDKLRRLEQIDGRNGKAAGIIGIAWIAVVLIGLGAWVIGRVVS